VVVDQVVQQVAQQEVRLEGQLVQVLGKLTTIKLSSNSQKKLTLRNLVQHQEDLEVDLVRQEDTEAVHTTVAARAHHMLLAEDHHLD